ncbi:MAG: cytochrome c [Burkholderiales bacterium]
MRHRIDVRRFCAACSLAACGLFFSVVPHLASADDAGANPYLGQTDALNEGEKIYRSRCFGCHFRAGGRGPNIFRSKLATNEFFNVVKNGGNSGMPAWGSIMSDEDIWKVHAFVMSRNRL